MLRPLLLSGLLTTLVGCSPQPQVATEPTASASAGALNTVAPTSGKPTDDNSAVNNQGEKRDGSASQPAALSHEVSGDIGTGYIVRLGIPASGVQPTGPRPLVIIDSSGKIISEGKNAVLCSTCGGRMGDPLQGVTVISGQGFVIEFEGGIRDHWQSQFAFTYDKLMNDWLLSKAEFRSTDMVAQRSTSNTVHRKEIGEIRLGEFDATKYLEKLKTGGDP